MNGKLLIFQLVISKFFSSIWPMLTSWRATIPMQRNDIGSAYKLNRTIYLDLGLSIIWQFAVGGTRIQCSQMSAIRYIRDTRTFQSIKISIKRWICLSNRFFKHKTWEIVKIRNEELVYKKF